MMPSFEPAMSEQILRLFFAALLGGILGIERDLNARPSGLRTSMLITIGSCLYTLLSTNAFSGGEPTRVAAQIVTGIGFIGGGVILKDDEKIHGLTTAAHIWMAAAIGMTVGTGNLMLAAVVTVLSVFILVVLRPVGALLGTLGDNNERHRMRLFSRKKRS